MIVDFERSLLLVIWEVTRACALACILALTGGDPMWRKDLAELVGYARNSR